ncbi:MAG TPA: DUF1501 domain-containing protein [Kiritimatiellia bacterium]|nr:DUF1501 domain-containing protein [Kiritimatiellia bacterium]HMP33953.1 DUF1501 domain-containing protein [Kiritimatiellia bacterium]
MPNDILYTRRDFLRTGLLGGAMTWSAPTFLLSAMNALSASAADAATQAVTGRDGPILVVVQLSGGNDGLNTVIPYTNDFYRKARPTLAVPARDVLALGGDVGLHPALAGFRSLYDDGLAAVVQGVGYPNPNRSHFRSMEIWHTAVDANRASNRGWLGRYFDNACAGSDPTVAINLGKENPQAFAAKIPKGISYQPERPVAFEDPLGGLGMAAAAEDEAAGGSITTLRGGGGTEQVDALDFIERTALHAQVSSDQIGRISKAYTPRETFPNSGLGRDLRTVAQLIGGGMPTRIYYVSLGGFDTHANQAGSHRNLLATLGDAVRVFMAEMKRQDNLDRVLLLTFSEFGRRVDENAGQGTDHGAAAPCFLFGGAIKPGLHGTAPSLDPSRLVDGDLAFTTDFRALYASLLDHHLRADSATILGRRFDPLPVFRDQPERMRS